MSTTHVELPIEGMTCASCAVRIEKKLNKLEGVTATVNYATEAATVTLDPGRADYDDLVRAVEAAGYRVAVPRDEVATLRRRLVVALVLAAPLVVLGMVPPARFPGWEWLALALATPAVLWSGWQFHRAAAVNLRHGAVPRPISRSAP
jgi:Cu+-exporting ATPase